MYNGIGLTTPRGSGTNGFVTRNLSAVRKTKEKIEDYRDKEDAAVRPFDIELIEHDRRRQAEVRCMELQEMLEEEGVSEEEITKKVNAFRAKLLADKKSSVNRDSSGRAIVKDSHELSMAQEQKNEKAKNAFGIREDFVPGSSVSSMTKSAGEKGEGEGGVQNQKGVPSADKDKSEKDKKKKKSRRRDSSSSSSSSSSSNSDEEVKRKRRKREKKKKSKKSHHHRRHSHHSDKNKGDDRSRSRSREQQSTSDDGMCGCCESTGPIGCLTEYSIHSDSLDDDEMTPTDPSTPTTATLVTMNLNKEIVESPLYVLCQETPPPVDSTSIPSSTANHQILVLAEVVTRNDRSSVGSYHSSSKSSRDSRYRSRSSSRSLSSRESSTFSTSSSRSRSSSGSCSRRKSRSDSANSFDGRDPSRSRSRSSGGSRSTTRSRSVTRSRSRSVTRSRSRSPSSAVSVASMRSTRSLSIPRRRGSPSFLDRRRITSARKRPIPYKRAKGDEYDVSSETLSDDSDSEDDSSY